MSPLIDPFTVYTPSFRPEYGERPRHRYQNAYHKTSKVGGWSYVLGTAVEVTNISLPNLPAGVKFTIVDGSTVGPYGPTEFKVLKIQVGIYDRDSGVQIPPVFGLSNGCILPENYTPEQLAHRAAWLVRGAFDHEWREHFMVNGRRVLDPHGETELVL